MGPRRGFPAAVDMSGRAGAAKSPNEQQLRLIFLVARLYHVHGARQREIAERLRTSQARVSRLLRQAEELGLVRTVLVPADGLHPELEDELESRFGLAEAHVVEVPGGDESVPTTLGTVAARYLAGASLPGGVVGFTSWSTTLQAMSFALEGVSSRARTTHVVELLGDLGSPELQHRATRATLHFATILGAEAVFLRTPAVVASSSVRRTLVQDLHVQRALRLMDTMDIAFIGVGPSRLHPLLRPGDSYFREDQLESVRARGAVAELNQRFLDGAGRPVGSPLDDLVVGVSLDQVRAARRRVLVAGGTPKRGSVLAGLLGRWVDVLVTDVETARFALSAVRSAPHGALPAHAG